MSYIICVALIFIRNNHCTVGDGHSGGGGEFGGEGGRGAVICGFVPLLEVLCQAVSSGIRCRKQRDLEEQSVVY